MKKPTCFLDLDQTLYDTPKLVADVESYLRAVGHNDVNIRATMDLAIRQGYSFERHLRLLGHSDDRASRHVQILGDLIDRGDRYLLPGVADGLKILSESIDCALLTFGDPKFQGQKFRGVRAFSGVFTSKYYVWKRHTKGDVIRDRGPRRAWFLEDTPAHLEDARRKAPWAQRIRMRASDTVTEPHRGDGKRWIVLTSFAEFVELVLHPN